MTLKVVTRLRLPCERGLPLTVAGDMVCLGHYALLRLAILLPLFGLSLLLVLVIDFALLPRFPST